MKNVHAYISRKSKQLAVAAALVFGIAAVPALALPAMTMAATTGCSNTTVNGYTVNNNTPSETPCIGAPPINNNNTTTAGKGTDLIAKYVNPFIDFLAGAVGVVATISLVFSGIQYASSGDDPQKVAAAKKRITSTIMGLLAFLFLYAFLQWITPGGFLNS